MGKNSRPETASRQDVRIGLQTLFDGPLRESGSSDDLAAFTHLCCMSAIPNGTEDPKAFLRSMSDKFIENAKLNLCHLVKNRIAAQVAQFLFMEWCFRHGHLEEDWQWTWKSKTEGDLRYRERIPLQTLSGFAN